MCLLGVKIFNLVLASRTPQPSKIKIHQNWSTVFRVILLEEKQTEREREMPGKSYPSLVEVESETEYTLQRQYPW